MWLRVGKGNRNSFSVESTVSSQLLYPECCSSPASRHHYCTANTAAVGWAAPFTCCVLELSSRNRAGEGCFSQVQFQGSVAMHPDALGPLNGRK